MAKKLFAVVMVCLVVAAAVDLRFAAAAEAKDHDHSDESQLWKDCYQKCLKACGDDSGKDSSRCEMKCDNECDAQEEKAKLNSLV